jgi:hypothetical protein
MMGLAVGHGAASWGCCGGGGEHGGAERGLARDAQVVHDALASLSVRVSSAIDVLVTNGTCENMVLWA